MSATEADGWLFYGQPIRGRSCGSCKACCTQVPADLADEHKPANVRCKHLCSKGCGIYATRPTSCAYWSCRWLFDPLASELKRPDRGGYIVDPMIMDVLANGSPKKVIQIWVDPRRPNAHRDRDLRAYVASVAEHYRYAAIVRWAFNGGFVLIAPMLSGAADWIESYVEDVTQEQMQTTLAQIEARAQRRVGTN